MKTSRVVLLSSTLLLLAACGVKGDLVLPDQETPAPTIEPIDSPTDAAAQSDDGADAGEPAAAAQPATPPTEE